MNRSQVCVILAATGLSFILVFATVLKRTGMSSFEQLFFRLVFSLLILLSTVVYVSVALIYTQPIFTAVISFGTGREKPAVISVIVILIGVLGAFLVSGLVTASPQIGPGITFSVLAGFFMQFTFGLRGGRQRMSIRLCRFYSTRICLQCRSCSWLGCYHGILILIHCLSAP